MAEAMANLPFATSIQTSPDLEIPAESAFALAGITPSGRIRYGSSGAGIPQPVLEGLCSKQSKERNGNRAQLVHCNVPESRRGMLREKNCDPIAGDNATGG